VTNPSVDPLVGKAVAHYEILARLGGGGMGVVYKARDTRLGRVVALKFLPQQWSHDQDAKQRFVREAQAASATDHRNICTIHDIATAGDGQLFIVMAYYEGQTLKQRLEAGALPIEEALDIATQVAEGLARAHAQRVVHRDIKPGNLILAEDGVRILDFGLATFADALQLTVVGSTLGTAAYMSPEQVRGEAADARTDVWAVGAVLYQMLTGHVPFRGAYAEAIAYAIRNETPGSVRAERPEVPEEVEQLVFRALHKEPAVRFASGRELARALRQVRGQTLPVDLRTEAVVVPPLAQRTLPSRSRRFRTPLLTAAAIALLGALGGAGWMLIPIERTPIVIVPVANQTGFSELDPYRRALTHAMVEDLADSPSVRPLSWARELQTLRGFAAKGVDDSSREVSDALSRAGGSPILIIPTLQYEDNQWRVRVQIRDGSATDLEDYTSDGFASALKKETAHELIATAVEFVEKHFRPRGPRGWVTSIPPATRLATLDAAKAFEAGIDWYDEQEYAAAHRSFVEAGRLDPVSPLPQAWRSRAARSLRNDVEAALAANEAVKLLSGRAAPMGRLFVEAVAAESRADAAAAESRYGELIGSFPDDPRWRLERAAFKDRGAEDKAGWTAAVTAYGDVLELDDSLIRPHLERCRLYNRLQEPPNARREGEHALAASQESGWRGGEALARFCLVDLLRTGKEDERSQATGHAQKALKTLEEIGFAYNVPRALFYLGLAEGEQGRLVEAIAWWEKAAAAAADGGNVALRASILNNLGVSHHRLGSGSRAAAYYAQSAELYEALGDQRRAARQQYNNAALRIEHGIDADDAVREVENALEVVRSQGNAAFEVTCLELIGVYYRHVGKFAEAERQLNRALNLARQANLQQEVIAVTLEMVRLKLDQADYAAAKALLDGGVQERAGRSAAQAWVLSGRVLTRLGEFGAARQSLARAANDLANRNDTGLQPTLFQAMGELAFETRSYGEAREHFRKALESPEDVFRDPASVEAGAYLGLLDAIEGRNAYGERALQDCLARAQKMGWVSLEARCRVFLARMHLVRRNSPEAARVLADIGYESESRLGVEQRMHVHYWRSRSLVRREDAERELLSARKLFDELRRQLPEANHKDFMARPELQDVTG
jgi:serine/threonine protein kinase/tetratricopeptide (TPR) repeat protein